VTFNCRVGLFMRRGKIRQGFLPHTLRIVRMARRENTAVYWLKGERGPFPVVARSWNVYENFDGKTPRFSVNCALPKRKLRFWDWFLGRKSNGGN
jgi:hypothetical protein